MNKHKILGLILGVLLFIVMIASVTYAYLSWTSDDIKLTVGSKCFNVFYEKGKELTGDIMPSSDYTGGLSTSVKMNIDSDCDIKANGKLYLKTNEETSDNLFRDGLLNYYVLKDGVAITGGSGSITEEGEIEINLGELTGDTDASTSYTLYVWIDYNLVNNSDAFSSYLGSIRAEAIQIQ